MAARRKSAKESMDEEGAWLGTVIAASDMGVRSVAAGKLSHRLADMRGRIAALEADNAAKDEAVAAYFEFHGAEHEDVDCPADDTCECPLVVGINKAFGSGRPSATILEEHRKALVRMSRLEGTLNRLAETAWNVSQDDKMVIRTAGVLQRSVIEIHDLLTTRCEDGSCVKCRSGEPCR